MKTIKLWIPLIFIFTVGYAGEQLFVDQLKSCISISEQLYKTLSRVVQPNTLLKTKSIDMVDRPLYFAFPALRSNLIHIPLADLPTPILRLQSLESAIDSSCHIFFKDDGKTGMIKDGIREFGGNKLRKLEFLLADALNNGTQSVMTFGCIGSNHVVATGAACKKVGLKCYGLLKPQPDNLTVRRNRALMDFYGIQTFESPTDDLRNVKAIDLFIQLKKETGYMPYVIPTGGSCPIGAIGYINAAFELKEQIAQGIIKKPDYIYLAVNSCGTIAGLLLGLKSAELEITVRGIAVEPDYPANSFAQKVVLLAEKTNVLLHHYDESFPLFSWHEDELNLCNDFAGPGYGVETHESIESKELLFNSEKIILDPTYTAKAFAGLLHDIESSKIESEATVLFWNTFCFKN